MAEAAPSTNDATRGPHYDLKRSILSMCDGDELTERLTETMDELRAEGDRDYCLISTIRADLEAASKSSDFECITALRLTEVLFDRLESTRRYDGVEAAIDEFAARATSIADK